jgi:hypothetical protein
MTVERAFKCRCCGHCCLNLADAYNGCVSDADLERWRRLGRVDLLCRVRTLELGPGNRLHAAWLDPETGDDVERCPWLLDRIDQAGYLCGIEDIKPDHCRDYPEHRRHAEATGCAGYREERTQGISRNPHQAGA